MNAAEFIKDISHIGALLLSDEVYIITDTNVKNYYPQMFVNIRHTAIKAGEENKNLETVGQIISDMVEAGCDRNSTVIAVGGGVVGDTAGYAAASFMRGVKWINIPTTLLACVDSGIGGKTGVDVGGYKNVAGAFHLPERVLICPLWLETLPEREWLCGCGEMIKHALLSPAIYDVTAPNLGKLLGRDKNITAQLIELNVRYKESVVKADFKESGLRKRLNVGHTVGHAIENLDGFKYSHGEYVALGIIAEAAMLQDKLDTEFYAQVIAMAKSVCRHSFPLFSADNITDAARADKKNSNGNIVIMLPVGGGETKEVSLSPSEFKERLESCLLSL